MKNTDYYLKEIKEIRQMMEQSSRFLSLSGLSGILIGIYALAVAFVAYRLIYFPQSYNYKNVLADGIVVNLILIAVLLIVISFVTVVWLTYRRAKKDGKKIWNPGSRLMLLNLAIPLLGGGAFIIIELIHGIYSIVSPSCLIFYGLALVNAAKFTRQEIFYLGLFQIALGLIAAFLPHYGLLIWAIGFGIIHIVYGEVMYFRYESKTKLEM